MLIKDKILKNILSKLLNSDSLMKMRSNMNNHDLINPENKILEIMNSIS